MLLEVRDGGLAIILDVQSFCFLLRKVWFSLWPDIMLSQTLIYYWQEIFLLTDVRHWSHPLSLSSMVSLSGIIKKKVSLWYHYIVCGLNRTIERLVIMNVTWLGFVFVLVSLFTCTVRLLLHRSFTFSSCANKAGSLQNEYQKCE